MRKFLVFLDVHWIYGTRGGNKVLSLNFEAILMDHIYQTTAQELPQENSSEDSATAVLLNMPA